MIDFKQMMILLGLYRRYLIFFLLFLSFGINLSASDKTDISIQNSYYLISTKALSYSEVREKKLHQFKPFDIKKHFNYGFSKADLWIVFDMHNPSSTQKTVLLWLDNPLLEYIDLYDDDLISSVGLLQRENLPSMYPFFNITLQKGEKSTYYLHVHSTATSLQFGLHLSHPKTFFQQINRYKHIIIFFLGMLASLGILCLLIYFYSHDRSYLYYFLYLITLVFQQVTYTGFLPFYAPLWFNSFDNAIVVPKLTIMLISGAFYARAFLHTQMSPSIDRGYRIFSWIALIQIPIVGTHNFYFPEVILLIGVIFIIFNTYAGINIYLNGYKAARFFVLAWFILSVGYIVIIFDALGFISVMYRFPMLIMGITVIEALLLMLAFVDRFYHYQLQKLAFEQRYNKLLEEQKEQITEEVLKRTTQLYKTMNEKETLFKELHHRVKNNLQLILSLIRLQRSRATLEETKDTLLAFEHRIETIANTHEILFQNGANELVDMQHYLDSLSHGLVKALTQRSYQLNCDCDIKLPLKEAVYIGLILNELLTNYFKHAQDSGSLVISLIMYKNEKDIFMRIGMPHSVKSDLYKNQGGLGLLIVKTLVFGQLEGTIEQSIDDKSIVIKFRS